MERISLPLAECKIAWSSELEIHCQYVEMQKKNDVTFVLIVISF